MFSGNTVDDAQLVEVNEVLRSVLDDINEAVRTHSGIIAVATSATTMSTTIFEVTSVTYMFRAEELAALKRAHADDLLVCLAVGVQLAHPTAHTMPITAKCDDGYCITGVKVLLNKPSPRAAQLTRLCDPEDALASTQPPGLSTHLDEILTKCIRSLSDMIGKAVISDADTMWTHMFSRKELFGLGQRAMVLVLTLQTLYPAVHLAPMVVRDDDDYAIAGIQITYRPSLAVADSTLNCP